MTTPTTRSTSHYERYAGAAPENYERHFVPAIGEPVARRLLESARLRPGERVLDVACGTGIVTRLAAAAVGPGGSVAGLDANPGMLAVARTASGPAPIDWHQGPAEQLPLAEQTFDAVVCSMGLQFFSDRQGALGEMHRVLAPGGRVVLCTPGPTPPLFEAIDEALVAHAGPGASMFVHAVFSISDPDEVRNLLVAAGFEGVAVETDRARLRVAPPADFFWQYVRSTPLDAVMADLGEAGRAALEREVVERCGPFVDGDGTVLEPGLVIATARRPGTGRPSAPRR
ncbi:MAG TPA: methyltransferase domain-containing protein [Acidimicrobiales bacterium]|nr:methyltransferase domain-containing protein [Acidimicrobiales bacterium]